VKHVYQQKLCLGLLGNVPALKQIPMLRDAGFDGFFSGWDRNTDLQTLKKTGEQAGMLYQSVHAPFHHVDALWHENAHTSQAVEELVDCVRATADAEVSIMVCHAFIGFDKHCPTSEGLRNFEPIIREAERLGVKVALENTEGEEYLAALMQHFAGSPAVGFCWDTGHEMCYNHSQNMLALYGDRLLCTHLNDNLGIKDYTGQISWRDDLHLLPFDGIGDWGNIVRRLNQHHFDGPLTFELTTASKEGRHDNDFYASMDFRVYLAMAYQRACRIAALKLKDCTRE